MYTLHIQFLMLFNISPAYVFPTFCDITTILKFIKPREKKKLVIPGCLRKHQLRTDIVNYGYT